ncbi:MAG: Crp/Fnr family transcriptional regulator [Endomicrobia bacterium]|nr:Crp/Fnr family transcriptional regulator [Endomicrobiia bacterium]
MEKYMEVLKDNILFNGLSFKQIGDMLFQLNPSVKKYIKGEFIINAGDRVRDVSIVLEGNIKIIKEDIRGIRCVIAQCGRGDMFAEALACAHTDFSPVSVTANTACSVMFVNFDKITGFKIKPAEIASKLVRNMLTILAKKNVYLNDKLEHIGKRSIREKLLSYLAQQHLLSGKKIFTLPFTKTDLADFLFIDRSAMSRELTNMRKEKLIDFDGNTFKIIKK